jgi:hypothetical protein
MDETSRSPELAGNQSTRQLLDELDALMQRMLALPVDEPQTTDSLAPTPVQPKPAAAAITQETLKPAAVVSAGATSEAPRIFQQATLREPVTGLAPVAAELPAAVSTKAVALSPSLQPPPAPARSDSSPRRESRAAAPVPQPEAGPIPIKRTSTPLVPIIMPRQQATSKPSAASVATMTPVKQPVPPAQPLPPARPVWLKPSASPKSPPPAPPPRSGSVPGLLLAINWIFDCITHIFGPLGRWLRGVEGRAWLGWTGIAMLLGAGAWAAFLFLG